MKKQYVVPEAVKISLENEKMLAYSMPDSCIQIVANRVVGQTCINPEETVSFMWFLDNPYGD